MKKEKDFDTVHDFWNKYWNADMLKRIKMIEDTQCFNRMFDVITDKRLPKKTKKHVFNTMLQSYFDDLLSTMEK